MPQTSMPAGFRNHQKPFPTYNKSIVAFDAADAYRLAIFSDGTVGQVTGVWGVNGFYLITVPVPVLPTLRVEDAANITYAGLPGSTVTN